MAQHNPNGDGEPGPTPAEQPAQAHASDVDRAEPGDGRTGEAGPDAGVQHGGAAEHGRAAEHSGAVQQGGAAEQGTGTAPDGNVGEQQGPPGAEPNPWARPGSVPAAGYEGHGAGGTDVDAPTDQHAVGGPPAHAAAAYPSSGQYPADASAAGAQQPGTYSGTGTPYPGPQYPAGQYQAAQYPTGDHPTAQYPAAQYATGQYATGQYATGQYATGQYPAAQYATGPYPSTPYPTGQYPGGAYPPPSGPAPAGPGRGRRNRTIGLIAAGIVIALLAGALGGVIGAGTDRASTTTVDGGVLADPLPEVDPDQPLTPVEQVAARVLPSVVQIRVEGGTLSRGELGEGSGMVLSGDGLVLTNNHVIEPAAAGGTLRVVFQDGRTAPIRIVGRDPESDIALVKADNIVGLTPIELGNSDGVRVGQQVTAVGSPLGLGGSVTTGIISALNRAVSLGPESGATSPTVLSALQTDAAINPGNSGGPLVDMQGRVVGINSAIATAGPGGGSIGVGFAIPVNQAKRIADQLRTTGRATQALLGVEVSDDPQQTGARLRTVTPDGPAARAGLKPGDLVVRLDGQPITSGEDLQAAVRSQEPGAVVEVQLSDRTTQVTLGES